MLTWNNHPDERAFVPGFERCSSTPLEPIKIIMSLDALERARKTVWLNLYHLFCKASQHRAKKYFPWLLIYPAGKRMSVWVSPCVPSYIGQCQRGSFLSHPIQSANQNLNDSEGGKRWGKWQNSWRTLNGHCFADFI